MHVLVISVLDFYGGIHTDNVATGQLKCDGTREETGFRLSGEKNESI